MTAQEFVEKYKGRRVRVNDRAVSFEQIGKEGFVDEVASDRLDDLLVSIVLDDGSAPYLFQPHKLDVLDEKPRKVVPLPLPG